MHLSLDYRDETPRRQWPFNFPVQKTVRTLCAVVGSYQLAADIPKTRWIYAPFFDVVFDEIVVDEDVNVPGNASVLDLKRFSDVNYRLLRDQFEWEMGKCH